MVIYGRSFCVVSTSGDPYGATNSTSGYCGNTITSSIDVTDSYDTYERIYFDSSTVYRGDDKRFNYFRYKELNPKFRPHVRQIRKPQGFIQTKLRRGLK